MRSWSKTNRDARHIQTRSGSIRSVGSRHSGASPALRRIPAPRAARLMCFGSLCAAGTILMIQALQAPALRRLEVCGTVRRFPERSPYSQGGKSRFSTACWSAKSPRAALERETFEGTSALRNRSQRGGHCFQHAGAEVPGVKIASPDRADRRNFLSYAMRKFQHLCTT
jgi:hypothetical protein